MIRKDLNIFYPVMKNGAVIGIPDDFDNKNSNSKKLNTRISGSLNREEIIEIIKKLEKKMILNLKVFRLVHRKNNG